MNALERFTDNTALRLRRGEEARTAKARMAAEEERLKLLGLAMDPLANLPPEVMLLVFEFAAFTSHNTCLTLCRVCSAAWKIATPILYESIWVDCVRLRTLRRDISNRRQDGDPLRQTKSLVLSLSTMTGLGETLIMDSEQGSPDKKERDNHFIRNIYGMSELFSIMESLSSISLDPSTFKALFPLFWAPRAPFSSSTRPFPNVTLLQQQLTTSEEWKAYLTPETLLMHIGHARNSITHLEVHPVNACKIFEGPFGSGVLQAFPLLTHVAWTADTEWWLDAGLPHPSMTLTSVDSVIPEYPLGIFGPVVKPLPEQIQLAVFRILVLAKHTDDKVLISDTCESHVADHAARSWGRLGGRWIVLAEDEGSPLAPLIDGLDMWERAERRKTALRLSLEFSVDRMGI